MQIIWKGQSCFQIIASQAKNSQVKIVINPFSEGVGLRYTKLEADILLVSNNGYGHNIKLIESTPESKNYFLIEGPGEYETKEVFIRGVQSLSEEVKKGAWDTIYNIEAEGLKVCHLGDFNQKELTEDQLDKIGEVDVLMIPVGGNGTISAKEAVKIISQIEPKITIPMYYHIPKLEIKLDGVDKFLKILGLKSVAPLDKLSIKQKDISSEEAKIVVLNP